MYKPDAPPGWALLDEFHSPGMTARYVRERPDGYYEVVDVSTTGAAGEYSVDVTVERGIFDEGPDDARPYINTAVRSHERLAENVAEDRAYELAFRHMEGGGGSGDFDFS